MFTSSNSCPSHSWLNCPLSPTLWKYTRSQCLWPDIQLVKDWVGSASYIMFSSSSWCLSWLDFPTGSNIIKVYKVNVFMTWHSNAKSLCSINKVCNVSISNSRLSRSWLDLPSGFNGIKVHKASVFKIQYCNAERSSSVNNLHYTHIFQFVPFPFRTWFFPQVLYYGSIQGHSAYGRILQCWKTELHQQGTLCSHLPVRDIQVHGLISTPGQILWRYTRSLCLWLDIQCLKTQLCQQPTKCLHFPVHSIYGLGLIVPWVQYCGSTQGHSVYCPIFQWWKTELSLQDTLYICIFQSVPCVTWFLHWFSY